MLAVKEYFISRKEGFTMWNLMVWLLLIGVGCAVLFLLWKAFFFFVRFVTVEEATAVAFKVMGRFHCVVMAFENHHFDTDGNICDGEAGRKSYGKRWFIWRVGGWVFYLHPFIKPAYYTEYNVPDGFGHDIYIHLNDITPEPVTTAAETAPPENVPITARFVATMRVINPYRWLFPSPKDVNNQVLRRLDAVLRAWVRSGKQEHAQAARGDGEKLWEDLAAEGCMPIFAKIEKDWGLRILEKSIIVEDIGYDPEYQAALKSQSQETLLAKAKANKIAVIDVAMDKWVRSQAKLMKKKPSEALESLRADGSWARQREMYMAQILAENADLFLAGNPDGSSFKGDLGPATAMFAAAFGKRGRQTSRGGKNPGSNKEGVLPNKERGEYTSEDVKDKLSGLGKG